MLLTLLSLFGGGLMRLLPEILAFMNRRVDNSHELAMMDKQLELQRSKSADDRETIAMQGDVDQTLALLAAQRSALEGQMQKTGFWLVDALNFMVRPVYAYTSLLFYYLAKSAMFVMVLRTTGSGWETLLKIYTPEDFAFLTGIASFYFVGRVIDKRK